MWKLIDTRDWYSGYRTGQGDSIWAVHEAGANRRIVNPFEIALVNLDRPFNIREDAGDNEFRRSRLVDQETRRILWQRKG